MFLDGDDVDDLRGVLHGLADRVADYRQARVPRPLPLIVDRHEPMGAAAPYLATVTSSLTPTHDPASPRAWRGLAEMVDGTRMVLDNVVRPDRLVPDHRDLTITTTHTLRCPTAFEPFDRQHRWRFAERSDLADQDLRETQHALARLHALVTDTATSTTAREGR